MIDLAATFEKYDDEFLEFKRIAEPMHQRPDLHAFLLLDSLLPGTTDMIAGAEHDAFYLSVDAEALAALATEENIRDLARCGVFLDGETDSLKMYT